MEQENYIHPYAKYFIQQSCLWIDINDKSIHEICYLKMVSIPSFGAVKLN